MTKTSGKVEALLAKHPTLSQEEAIKIIADKNERKKNKRLKKTNKSNTQDISTSPETSNGHEA